MNQINTGVAIACLGLLVLVIAELGRLHTRISAISRVEGKLDRLLAQAGIAYDLYANLPPGVEDALRRGEKIQAIKLYREATQAGLRDAKEFIEEVQRRAGDPV
jgi:ribosomal protein L7/L12